MDEKLLKSVTTSGEELEKAIDKSKLVPVPVQVTRQGKVFTKTVWKKASEVEAMKNKAPKKQDEQKSPSKKDADSGGTTSYKGFAIMKHDGESDYTIHYDEGTVYMKGLKSVDDAKSAIDNKDSKPRFDHVLPDEVTSLEPMTDSERKIFDRLSRAKDFSSSGEYMSVKNFFYNADLSVTKNRPDFDNLVKKGYLAVKDSGTINASFKLTKLGSEALAGKEKQSSLDFSEFEKLKKTDKAGALKYLKDNGVTWEENSHAAINMMRATMAAKAKSGTSKAPTSKDIPNQLKKPKPESKPAEEAKPKETPKENKHKAYLDELKSKGITWKESDHVAINVMRAKMAEKKFNAGEGGKSNFIEENFKPGQEFYYQNSKFKVKTLTEDSILALKDGDPDKGMYPTFSIDEAKDIVSRADYHKSRYDKEQAYLKKVAEEEKEESKKKKEEEDKYNNLWGYGEDLDPKTKARVRKTLNSTVARNGSAVVVKDLYKDLVDKGYRPSSFKGKDVLLDSKTNSFIDIHTKTGLDFINFLVKQTTDAKTPKRVQRSITGNQVKVVNSSISKYIKDPIVQPSGFATEAIKFKTDKPILKDVKIFFDKGNKLNTIEFGTNSIGAERSEKVPGWDSYKEEYDLNNPEVKKLVDKFSKADSLSRKLREAFANSDNVEIVDNVKVVRSGYNDMIASYQNSPTLKVKRNLTDAELDDVIKAISTLK